MKSIELKKQGLPPTKLGVVGFTLLSIAITGIANIIIITAAMFIIPAFMQLGADPGGYIVVAFLSILIGLGCSVVIGFFTSKLLLRIISSYKITKTSIVFSLVNLLNIITYGLFTPLVVVSVLVKQKIMRTRWLVMTILLSILVPFGIVSSVVLNMHQTTYNTVKKNTSLALPANGDIADPFGDGEWKLAPLGPVEVHESNGMVTIAYDKGREWTRLEMHNDNLCSQPLQRCIKVATLESGESVYRYTSNSYLVVRGKGSWVITRGSYRQTPDFAVKVFNSFKPVTYEEFNNQMKDQGIKFDHKKDAES